MFKVNNIVLVILGWGKRRKVNNLVLLYSFYYKFEKNQHIVLHLFLIIIITYYYQLGVVQHCSKYTCRGFFFKNLSNFPYVSKVPDREVQLKKHSTRKKYTGTKIRQAQVKISAFVYTTRNMVKNRKINPFQGNVYF